MASEFPQRGSLITRASTRAWAAILLSCLATAQPATANTDETRALSPYRATYDTSALGMHLTLNRELKTNGEGQYTLTNGGKILVAGFHEVAVFHVDGSEVIPKSYVYQGTGLINRRREVHFTPGADTLRSLYKGEWYELPYTDGTLDRMSQQEHLRLILMNDPRPRDDLSIRVADGRKVKDYEIRYVGEEVIETPLGPVKTLHLERLHDDPERESDVWVAPAWDYLIVKTLHVEDGNEVEMMLTSATIDGQAVAADPSSRPAAP